MPALRARYAWGRLDPTLIVTEADGGGVRILDVVANTSFVIARATPPNATPDITSDGAFVVMRDAALDSKAIAIWRLDLPASREATARWLDDLTNATFDPRTGTLAWPPL